MLVFAVESGHVTDLVLVILGIAGFYLFIVPLLLSFTLKLKGSPEVIEFEPEQAPLPSELSLFFSQSGEQLSELGFESLLTCLMPDPVPNVKTVLTLYANSVTQDFAMVVVLWGFSGEKQILQNQYVEFMTDFSDGHVKEINTTSNLEVDPFVLPPDRLVFRCPSLCEPSSIPVLYKIHQELINFHASGSKKVMTLVDEFHGDVTTYLRDEVLKAGYNRQVDFGVLKYNSKLDLFTPTFFGGYRMIWKCLPPFKGYIQAGYKRKGKKIIQEFYNEYLD